MATAGIQYKPVGIFWDVENCAVPPTKSASAIIAYIRNFFVQNRLNHREFEFIIACDVSRLRTDVPEDVNRAGGVTLAHVCGTSKNAADEVLRQSMKKFVDTHVSTCSPMIILISSDIDYVNDLRGYQTRLGCTVVIIHDSSCSPQFKIGWNEIYSYKDFCLAVPVNPVLEAKLASKQGRVKAVPRQPQVKVEQQQQHKLNMAGAAVAGAEAVEGQNKKKKPAKGNGEQGTSAPGAIPKKPDGAGNGSNKQQKSGSPNPTGKVEQDGKAKPDALGQQQQQGQLGQVKEGQEAKPKIQGQSVTPPIGPNDWSTWISSLPPQEQAQAVANGPIPIPASNQDQQQKKSRRSKKKSKNPEQNGSQSGSPPTSSSGSPPQVGGEAFPMGQPQRQQQPKKQKQPNAPAPAQPNQQQQAGKKNKAKNGPQGNQQRQESSPPLATGGPGPSSSNKLQPPATERQLSNEMGKLEIKPPANNQQPQPKPKFVLNVTALPGNMDSNLLRKHLQVPAKLVGGQVQFVGGGQAYISFKTQESADRALEVFDGLEVYGKKVKVKFAKNKQPANNQQQQQPKSKFVIIVTGLPGKIDSETLKNTLQVPAQLLCGKVKYVNGGQAFIRFNTKASADRALEVFNGVETFGKTLRAGFAQNLPYENAKTQGKKLKSWPAQPPRAPVSPDPSGSPDGFVMVNAADVPPVAAVAEYSAAAPPVGSATASGSLSESKEENSSNSESDKEETPPPDNLEAAAATASAADVPNWAEWLNNPEFAKHLGAFAGAAMREYSTSAPGSAPRKGPAGGDPQCSIQ